MTTASVELPLPPSVNAAFFNRRAGGRGRGRIKSAAYRDWQAEAGWTAKLASLPKFKGTYSVSIALHHKMRGDVDNRTKPILDLLVSLETTPDDRHCSRVVAWRSMSVPPGRCLVQIEGTL